ncbi:MAG: nuclear transport factor 2 family protein [Bacteroidales bacterium]
MKKMFLLLIGLCMPMMMMAEEAAVRKVVQGAYIDGLQNLGDIQTIRDGFHPDFVMLMFRNGQLSKLDIQTWIQGVERRKNDPNAAKPNIKGKFIDVEVTGSVAQVKLELYRENQLLFTDYISLYKFSDGWKIVSKVYNQH